MTKTVKLFLDTEMTGLHKNTTLISLALVTEFNDVFYAEFNDYDKTQVNEWLQDNVITNLLHNDMDYWSKCIHTNQLSFIIKHNTNYIKTRLINWLEELQDKHQVNNFEIWIDCLAYDWVLFNDLFGTAFDLPKSIYYIPFDICTVFKLKDIDPDINREEFSEFKYTEEDKKHNSLTDSRVLKCCYEKLEKLKTIPDFPNYLIDLHTADIFSIKNNKLEKLKPSLSNGYYTVTLYSKNKKYSTNVHRCVMAAKLNTWLWDKPEVNHIDHNRTNNNILNLELADRLDQMDAITKNKIRDRHLGKTISKEHIAKLLTYSVGALNNKAKLTDNIVSKILEEYNTYLGSKSSFVKKMSILYSVSTSSIYRILNKTSWKHLK